MPKHTVGTREACLMRFLQAHGYDPGPTQRPLLAGAVAGTLAELPAAAVLWTAGSVDALADALRAPALMLLLA